MPLHLTSQNKCTVNLTSLSLAQKVLNYPKKQSCHSSNRWVIMAELIPWAEFEAEYAKNFSEDQGAPAKSFRIALGSLIIKERLGINDRETVQQIKENPYLQYFIGLTSYQQEAPLEFLDHLSWDNFNESGDLKTQIEEYKSFTGYYPNSVHVDRIYRTRENRDWCKERGIRISGPPLGRPPKNVSKSTKKQAVEDERVRNAIEGKFGQAKRRYSLNCIMTKRHETSETSIAITFLVKLLCI